jgi:hypothetical protein
MTFRRLRIFEARAVGSYMLRVEDLAVFRILYASYILIAVVPIAEWLPLAPRVFLYPPLGLPALFTGPPPSRVLLILNVLLALVTAMLLVGWRTGIASAGTGLTLLALNSCAYSLGKINHDILLVVTPLVLGFAGWGRAFSADSAGRPPAAGEGAEAWPVALLALLVGFAMWSAGWEKASSGWLDPELLCTYGHLVYNYVFTGRETWAAKLLLRVDSAWMWKAADWATVALELAFLPAAIHRRLFDPVLAAAALFHLGVLSLFHIPFAVNIVVYGAFIPYTTLPFLRNLSGAICISRPVAVVTFVTAFALGLVAALRRETAVHVLSIPLDDIILLTGAVVGGGYVFQTLWGRGPGVVPPTERLN